MAKDTGKKVAIGVTLAGVAGYVAGILTAPKSGEDTRKDIAKGAQDLKDSAAAQLRELNDELKDLINETKGRTIALSASARQEFDEALIKAKDAQNKAATVLKAVKNGEADDPQLAAAIKQVKQAKKNLAKYLKK